MYITIIYYSGKRRAVHKASEGVAAIWAALAAEVCVTAHPGRRRSRRWTQHRPAFVRFGGITI